MIVFQRLEWADDFESATLASLYSSILSCMFCYNTKKLYL